MWVLKDATCGRCGGDKIRVGRYLLPDYDPLVVEGFYAKGTHVVGSAACHDCLKESVLPVERYSEFVQEHCKRI